MKKLKLEQDTQLYLLLLSLSLLKFLIYGFRYFPVLDDFIQYDGYRMYESLSYVYFNIGTISTRPLASLLDPLFWGAMPLGLSLFVINAMHFASCIFFYKSAEKLGFELGSVFGIIYLLLPLGFESTYWLSASTRIVTGLFFSSVGIYFLACNICDKKKWQLALFWLCTFLCGGFYEAALCFALVLSLIIMIYFRKKIKNKWIFAIPFINGAAFCGIYAALSGIGAMHARTEGFSFKEIFAGEKFSSFFAQLFEIMKISNAELIKSAFTKGLNTLFCGKFSFFIVAILMILASAMFLFLKEKRKKTERAKKVLPLVLLGIIMFFAPLLVNFLAKEMWLTLRSFGFSIFGIALVLDRVFALIKFPKLIKTISFALSLSFLVCCAGEYSAYKEVSEADVLISQKIVSCLDESVLGGEREAIVLFKNEPYKSEIYNYKDHIKSVTESDWALTGAVRSVARNIKIKKVTPVYNAADITKEDAQIIYID